MNTGAQRTQRKPRRGKACSRCRKRKIRCDFDYPSCGACSTAGTTCLSFEPARGETPRSTISHLEKEVARLESSLASIKNHSATTSDVANATVERLATHLATAAVAANDSIRVQETLTPLAPYFYLFGSPLPCLKNQASDVDNAESSPGSPPQAITLSSVPRHVVDLLLKHYCDFYRPQYPAVDDKELRQACDRVYGNSHPSDYDIFSVHTTLAISMNTLMHRDEKRATVGTKGFWATAVLHLTQLPSINSWERLQALQLLTHFAFLNPAIVDCSKCSAAAVRLCLQLGLHHELPLSAQESMDLTTLDNRRRLFWNSYCMHMPFIVPRDLYQYVKYPDFDAQSSSTPHFWLLRKLEYEITMAMYHPSLASEEQPWNTSFLHWYEGMETRLYNWNQTTRQNVNLSQKIEFHELLFQCQVLRMTRPSPRYPSPRKEMRTKNLQASIALIKEFSAINRAGKFFMFWHAAFFILEAGVCLLASICTEMDLSRRNPKRFEDIIEMSMNYMTTAPSLLWKVTSRWPEVAQHATALDTISLSVLDMAQRWRRGEPVSRTDLANTKQILNRFSRFPLFVLEAHTSDETGTATTNAHAISGVDAISQDVPRIVDVSNPQSASAVAPDIGLDWTGSQMALNPESTLLSDAYGYDDPTLLSWDFSGTTSEEILAALFDEREFQVL